MPSANRPTTPNNTKLHINDFVSTHASKPEQSLHRNHSSFGTVSDPSEEITIVQFH